MHSLHLRIVYTIPIVLLLPLVIIQVVEGGVGGDVEQNKTTGLRATSRWLNTVINPRTIGCWDRPWICNEWKFPPVIKKLCCKNRCVDVTLDMNNCGVCGIRCPFTWQCCNGLCIDTNINPFHCGKCWNRCPFMSLCFYGMCGYAQPLPPFPFPPFPFPPKQPFPPFPFPPKKPLPPFPFPPKKPFPPFPFPPKKPFPPFPFPPKKPMPPFPFPPKKPFPPKPPKPCPPKPPKMGPPAQDL